MVRVFITKLLKILCFTAFKTYSDRALPTERGDLLVKIKRWKWFLCKARFVLDNNFGGYRCRSQVPEHEILKIVRMYEPIITEFFDNEEEMAKFQKWREEYEEKERLEKEEKAKKKAGAA